MASDQQIRVEYDFIWHQRTHWRTEMLSELSAVTGGAGSSAPAPHIDGQHSQGVFRGFSWRGTNKFPHTPNAYRVAPGQPYVPQLNWPPLDDPTARSATEPGLGVLRGLMSLHERALVHAETLLRQGVTADENVMARLGEIVGAFESGQERYQALLRTGGLRYGP